MDALFEYSQKFCGLYEASQYGTIENLAVDKLKGIECPKYKIFLKKNARR
jgi:hypothetical protein